MVVLLWLSSCCYLNTVRRWLFYFGCLLAVISILRGDGCFTLPTSCCHLSTERRWLFYFGCLLLVILILREDGCFTLAVFLSSYYCEKMVVLLGCVLAVLS